MHDAFSLKRTVLMKNSIRVADITSLVQLYMKTAHITSAETAVTIRGVTRRTTALRCVLFVRYSNFTQICSFFFYDMKSYDKI